jgi:hypothetical protein
MNRYWFILLFILIGNKNCFCQFSNRTLFFISSFGKLTTSSSYSYPVSLNSLKNCIDIKSGLAILTAPRGTGEFSINCNTNLIFNNLGLNIFPNPVRYIATIKVNNLPVTNEDFVVSVYSGDGTILVSSTKKTIPELKTGFQFDCSQIPDGLYVLKVYSSNYIDIIKFLKIS